MSGYSCWFCDRAIERTDPEAILIVVRGFWRWQDGSLADDDAAQNIYAHSACAKDHMKGARMDLEPAIFAGDD